MPATPAHPNRSCRWVPTRPGPDRVDAGPEVVVPGPDQARPSEADDERAAAVDAAAAAAAAAPDEAAAAAAAAAVGAAPEENHVRVPQPHPAGDADACTHLSTGRSLRSTA